jgi:hypothetical protein
VALAAARQANRLETLPMLTEADLAGIPSGSPVAVEGRISERNTGHFEGLAAYVVREYRGVECDEDDDGYTDCSDVWVEVEQVTPALWLDIPGGRLRVRNYQLHC